MNNRQTWEEWGQKLDKDKSNFLVVLARNNLFLKRIEKNYLPTLSFISRQGGSNFQVECKKPRILFQLKRSQNWPNLSQETQNYKSDCTKNTLKKLDHDLLRLLDVFLWECDWISKDGATKTSTIRYALKKKKRHYLGIFPKRRTPPPPPPPFGNPLSKKNF